MHMSKGSYAVAIEKSFGVYLIVTTHKKFERARAVCELKREKEPDKKWVIIKEHYGSVVEIPTMIWDVRKLSSKEIKHVHEPWTDDIGW